MRRTVVVVTLTALLAGCGLFKHSPDVVPDYSAKTTAIWGDWTLRDPDSTSFIGAKRVDLSMQPGTFTIRAMYPGAPASTITGSVEVSSTGVVTLVPTMSLVTPSGHATNLVAGQPVVLIASAAGGTMVFAPASRTDPTPSSVWNRTSAAEAAGLVSKSP